MKSDFWVKVLDWTEHLILLSPYIPLKIKQRDLEKKEKSVNMGKPRDTATKFWKLENRWSQASRRTSEMS